MTKVGDNVLYKDISLEVIHVYKNGDLELATDSYKARVPVAAVQKIPVVKNRTKAKKKDIKEFKKRYESCKWTRNYTARRESVHSNSELF